ncbi:MAG: 50S ribosomal protein L4 [Clostridia bacterium]|nr:50S ribosomal protein L4 [Clostridia bacterium]
MPNVAVYNMEGKQVGDINLNDALFGQEVNTSVLHQVVVNYLANQRQGTQSTKTRSEVRGGGIKPWRQKGTGRARQGSIRAPQWIKGGIALGPKPRDYSYTLNKKVKRVALKSALSSKVAEQEIIVVDEIAMTEIKTKTIANMLTNLNVNSKALIVTCDKNDNVVKSAKNIPGVGTAFTGSLNVYEILNHDKLIITKDAVSKLEEVYA